MKKIISLLLITVCLIGSLCSCQRVEDILYELTYSVNRNYTDGLAIYVIEDNECLVSVGSAGELDEIIIPKTIDGKRVVAIDEKGFAFLEKLKKITLPGDVYHIGDAAFIYCSSLEEIKLPTGVTHIGKEAFHGCKALQKIRLSEGLTRIEEKTFYYCTQLADVNLPSSLTYIGKNAFTGCNLTQITIPDGVRYIDEYAFSGCKSLTKAYIPENTRVGRYVFNGCDSLETLIYGGSKEQWEAMMQTNSYGTEDKSYIDVEIIFEK